MTNSTENKSWIKRLKSRWNLDSTFQVVIVLIVFACTGFSVMFLKKPLTELVFVDGEKPVWFTVLYWIFILPVYNLLLLFYGFIFGQFSFFWNFEKRFFSRLFGGAKKKVSTEKN